MAEHFEYYHLRRPRFFHLLVTICFQSHFPKKLKRGDSPFLRAILTRPENIYKSTVVSNKVKTKVGQKGLQLIFLYF